MEDLEKNLWEKVGFYLKFLRFVPFLRVVAVCNNLAFGKVGKHSDIDLFIIARSGRLFFVRSLVTMILQFLGVRRHGRKVAGRFCLSFFVDDSNLDLEKIAINQDVYLAYWVRSLKLVLNDGCGRDFFVANKWIESYFENFEIFSDSPVKLQFSGIKKFFEKIFGGWFGGFIERILKKWQLKRAKKKMLLVDDKSSLVVNEHMLKFHNTDRRKLFRREWFKVYGKDKKLTSGKFLMLAEALMESKV